MSSLYGFNPSCNVFTEADFRQMIKEIHESISSNTLVSKYDLTPLYVNAIEVYLQKRCIVFQRNKKIPIYYENEIIGYDEVPYIINKDSVMIIDYFHNISEERIQKSLQNFEYSNTYVINRDIIMSNKVIEDKHFVKVIKAQAV